MENIDIIISFDDLQDPRSATKSLLNKLLNEIHPVVIKIRNKIEIWSQNNEDSSKIRDVYTLCLSQLKKSISSLFEIFQKEYQNHIVLQETRQCNLDRLSWCLEKLKSIEIYLDKKSGDAKAQNENTDDSINVTIMYFVNWIDHAFEVLSKLSETVYKTNPQDSEECYNQWKTDIIECISALHLCIDELLLSAMTLCRYCLPGDQFIVKARCQVVLRETKALLSELIEGDLATVKATPESLKLPVMPTNINVMIDVLKDILYVLETNTNTALLTILVHCFSYCICPIDVLKEHFIQSPKGTCSCLTSTLDDVTDDCTFVKEFDLYNERLLQIGTFAVSCSSDQNRILALRSGIASLEALDPHLVPALMTSSESHHSELLIKSWRQEVQEIRDSVFLIVDPAAFADKSKQIMHQILLELLKETTYCGQNVCAVINVGCVVLDFFNVYKKLEPNALPEKDKLMPLLSDLNKVVLECKTVSNLLRSDNDFAYDIETPKQKEVSLDQVNKRLKLLYTLVSRINSLLQPKDQDQMFENEEEVAVVNATHTVLKNGLTCINLPKNVSRSLFARTQVRSSTRNIPFSNLTKHLRGKNCSQLNFSVQLEQICNLSNESNTAVHNGNKAISRAQDNPIFYMSPIKNRSNLRKAVLNRHLTAFGKGCDLDTNEIHKHSTQKENLMDESENLQIIEVLNEINNLTSTVCTSRRLNFTRDIGPESSSALPRHSNTEELHNVLSINVNNQNGSISKHIWKIPVNAGAVNLPLDDSVLTANTSSYTQPSNVSTLERINDLDFLESKLNSLKSQCETTL